MRLQQTLLAIAVGALSTCAATFGPAQKLSLPTAAAHPILSPDGKQMLYTSDNHCGLMLLDMATMNITTIDEAPAAGFNPAFSADSRSVVYRTASVDDGLTVRDVRVYDIPSATSRVKAPYSRSMDNAVTHAGLTKYAVADYKHISLTDNGVTKTISPLKDAHSYLWASLSPDGKHLLFSEPFYGIYVADADGSNPVRLAAKGDYPSWVDNDTIVYVLSHDDGYVILDSSLMTMSISDARPTALTDSDVKVGEATAANGTVAYSTLDGELYIIKAQ